MIIVRDEIATFIPMKSPEFIILGTMGSINARTINGIKPKDAFFYNNNRNHFWKVLQLVFEPNNQAKTLTIEEKKSFLNKHRIAMANIVQEIKVLEERSIDPSDDILFQANRMELLKYKRVSSDFQMILKKTPIFFTCRRKKNIDLLLEGYFQLNKIESSITKKIWYLPTPTRCNPLKRSIVWKQEIENHCSFLRG